MLKSLYARLALALLLVLGLIGLTFLVIARFATDMYYKEITQKLNAEIANFVVQEEQLIRRGQVNEQALAELAHMVMLVNPSVEIYLLGVDGEVLGFSAPPEKIKRRVVALAPLDEFLEENAELPVLGDDPRSLAGRKIFSVAPVREDGEMVGYLYAVLGGEKYEDVARSFRGSYILRLSGWAIAASLAFAFLAASLIFGFLTRRLRRLTAAVEAFERGEYQSIATGAEEGDEIDRLAQAFDEMSRRIAEQMGKLKKMDSLRRELVTNVSHDLRTPLASMQGYIETLLLKHDSLSAEESRRYLEIASKHGEQLNRLVDQLFELARLDSESIEPRRERFSLSELMQDVAQKFRLAAERKGVRLEVSPDPESPFVSGDIALIERVFENLIENALRHTPPGGKVGLELMRNDRHLEVRVSDTGAGIPEPDLPHIFDRLYRAAHGASAGASRTGLGLAIVKRILDLHGSAIRVHSRLNEGTTFFFELPVAA